MKNLCRELQDFINLLSKSKDNFSDTPMAFLLMGNPDARTFFYFARQWHALKSNIPIILTGGRGRGTLPLMLNISKYLKDERLFQQWIENKSILEIDLIEFVLRHQGVSLEYIFRENKPSKNTVENFIHTQNVLNFIRQQTKVNPIVAIVTSPPLLRRAGRVAKKTWENGWNILLWKTYDIDVTRLDYNELISFCGYLVGYPEEFVKLYPELNVRNELEGYQFVGGVVSQKEWEKLDSVKRAFRSFLTNSNISYDETTKNLILIKS